MGVVADSCCKKGEEYCDGAIKQFFRVYLQTKTSKILIPIVLLLHNKLASSLVDWNNNKHLLSNTSWSEG